MAEITKRRAGELVRGVFEILMEAPEGMPAKEVLQKLVERVPPTEFESTYYPDRPNERRYEKIVRFHTIGPVKAGWLVKDKGQWIITEDGVAAYHRFSDPAEFREEAVRRYREWKRQRDAESSSDEPDVIDEVEEQPDPATTIEEAEETAWTDIQRYLQELNPYDFQDLVAGLLRGMGYHVSWISPPGPDRGLDIIAHTDPLGIEGPRIKVQVKRRQDRTNVDGIRSFLALLSEGDVGIFVSTGGFTKDASDEARHQERRRLTLVSLQRLFDLWVEHYDQIPEPQRRHLPLRPVYYRDPDD